jgi:hypothetical protein
MADTHPRLEAAVRRFDAELHYTELVAAVHGFVRAVARPRLLPGYRRLEAVVSKIEGSEKLFADTLARTTKFKDVVRILLGVMFPGVVFRIQWVGIYDPIENYALDICTAGGLGPCSIKLAEYEHNTRLDFCWLVQERVEPMLAAKAKEAPCPR